MTVTVLVAGYTAALGMALRPLGRKTVALVRWLRGRWLLVAWDVPLTRGWEPRQWPGGWSDATGRWVRL